MLQEIEKVSATTRRLKINVPSDVIQSETDSVYNQIRATTRIPGFRPGKVPQAILVKKFSKSVEAQVIEKVVPQSYMEAIKESKLEPVSYPDIDEKKLEITPGQPLSFTVTIEVKPEIENVNYEGIVLKKKPVSVEDDEVERSIKLLQESKALYSVSDEELKESDMAIVDSDAFIDGQPVSELSYKEYPLVLGTPDMPKEFSDALTGKKKGDAVDIKLNFENDHPNKTIAGKEVLFKVVVTEAKKKNIPPVDDELAQSANCSTVDELRKTIHENLGKRKEGEINLSYKKEILDELIKRHEFDVPTSMVYGEIESMIHHEKQDAMKQGREVRPEDEMAKVFESRARENVKSVLLLEAIGKKDKIEITDEDVKKAIDEIAVRNNLKPEEVTKLYTVREGSMDALKSRLFADKVLEMILEKSTIQ
ncbi:MAG: trigger factor [Nitrospiraceae bacterium]|nr:MAG: trigger factor [Nitrospiraceae bacterium]